MTVRSVLEGVAMLTMAVAAVVLTANVVQKNSAEGNVSVSNTAEEYPAIVEDWPTLVSAARPTDTSDGEIRFVVFSDLECTACAMLHDNFAALDSARRNAISIAVLHYPLTSHRFSRIAASAAECAAESGKFGEFIGASYDLQSKIGLLGWGDFAARAGIADTSAFAACTREEFGSDRIDRDRALGDKIGLRYTPTTIVDGWRLSGTPSVDELARIIDSIRLGRPPFEGEL